MSFAHIPSQIQIGANKFGIEKFLKIKLVQVLVKHPLECLDNTPMMTTKNKTKRLQSMYYNTFYYKSFIKVISKVSYFILIGSLYISQLDFS